MGTKEENCKSRTKDITEHVQGEGGKEGGKEGGRASEAIKEDKEIGKRR